jgi:hypothetical protein
LQEKTENMLHPIRGGDSTGGSHIKYSFAGLLCTVFLWNIEKMEQFSNKDIQAGTKVAF